MNYEDIQRLTGQGYYIYEALEDVPAEELVRYISGSREKFGIKAGSWDEATNSEWLARFYLSLKMMLSSQLLVSSLKYAEERNLQLVIPYLSYYTLLNCSRALLFVSPTIAWRDGMLRENTHAKIINETANELARLSSTASERIRELLITAKNIRETFSYSFPATGMRVVSRHIPFDEVHSAATLLCELAEVNSECLASALKKKGITDCSVDQSLLKQICEYETPTAQVDLDDSYRTGYLVRKARLPTCLKLMSTDGLIEDFFGAWTPEDEETPLPDYFDPDVGYCGLIFDYTY